MALHDDPPHRCTVSALTPARDAGGGTKNTYASVQAAVPCSIDTVSADTQDRYARQQIVVTHTVGFLASVLTTPLSPGMKLAAGDTGGNFLVKGIRAGRSYGSIPAFVYADCEELL